MTLLTKILPFILLFCLIHTSAKAQLDDFGLTDVQRLKYEGFVHTATVKIYTSNDKTKPVVKSSGTLNGPGTSTFDLPNLHLFQQSHVVVYHGVRDDSTTDCVCPLCRDLPNRILCGTHPNQCEALRKRFLLKRIQFFNKRIARLNKRWQGFPNRVMFFDYCTHSLVHRDLVFRYLIHNSKYCVREFDSGRWHFASGLRERDSRTD